MFRSFQNARCNYGGPLWSFNKHKNLHFENEDIQVSFENFHESGYSFGFDSLTISY